MASREIRPLTGLRGVAACFVMAYHYAPGWHLSGRTKTFVEHGYLSVDLFFILSGFVMALTYSGAFLGDVVRGSYADFMSRRIGRVYPLYIVAMAIATAFGMYNSYIHLSSIGLVANALLIQTWGFADSYLGPSWSISTELAAYFVFPILVYLVLRRGAVALGATLIAVAVLFFVATRSTIELNQVRDGVPGRAGPLDVYGINTAYPLLRCLAGFTLGMFAYRIAQIPAVARIASTWIVAIISVSSVILLLLTPGADVAVVLSFVPLIIVLAMSRTPIANAFGSPVVHWLGVVSYSMYLVHWIVQWSLRHVVWSTLTQLHVPHAFSLTIPILCAFSIACAAVTYQLIEKPGRDLSRRFWHRPGRAAATQA